MKMNRKNEKKKPTQKQPQNGVISEIIPGSIYVGHKVAANDLNLLQQLKITLIANIGGGKVKFPEKFEYIRVGIKDNPWDMEVKEIVESMVYVAKGVKSHLESSVAPVVLFHCQGGMSRSPAYVAAYLTLYCNYSPSQAVEHCIRCRPRIKIAAPFMTALQHLPLNNNINNDDNNSSNNNISETNGESNNNNNDNLQ